MTEIRSGTPSRTANRLWLALVVLVGLNLRPFLTAIGPLTAGIAAETGLDYRAMAWLTLLPMLLMGIGAFLGTWLHRRLGARRAVLAALTALAAGSALRGLVPTGEALIATAALCGLGVAVVQATFPAEIKRQFPRHLALVTGLYSASLMGGGALGAQVTPLLAAAGGWRAALAFWAAPVAMALMLATRMLPTGRPQANGAPPSLARLGLARTWLLMSCFGLVNGGYASLVAWLPATYQSQGWSSAESGSLVAVMAVGQAIAALVLPALGAQGGDRRPGIRLTLSLQALGFACLAILPDRAPFLWALLLGAGLGGCFALFMVVALEHLPDPAEAGGLSALMQGGGFILAAVAPWFIAVLHAASGSFALGWYLHLACVLLVLGLSSRLNPERYAVAMARTRAPRGDSPVSP